MRRTTKLTFQTVSVKGTRRWKDPDTGRTRQETKSFFQTINPFNRNAEGEPKSYEEIMVEVKAQRDAWLAAGREGGAQ